MSLASTHPDYDQFLEDWEDMRNTFRGPSCIKALGTKYLPETTAHRLDGMEKDQDGYKDYQAYLKRAVFYDYVREGVQALIGLMYNKPPTIQLPAKLEPLRSRLGVTGEGAADLLRRINVEQLVTGRLGILVDVPANPTDSQVLPYLSLYHAESVINWDDDPQIVGPEGLQLVVLDETGNVRNPDGFTWTSQKRHRVLTVQDGKYVQGLFIEENYSESELKPVARLGKTLPRIPFQFINACDLVTTPDAPPLFGLAVIALAIYRADADHRQSLFMQGQDTLVTIGLRAGGEGADDVLRTGTGARIDVDIGGDAKYIGVESSGLSEQRTALEEDHKRAQSRAGQFATKMSNDRESGESLKTRLSAQTATLKQIAITGAAGLQNALRMIAEWVGVDPEEVIVEPNLEFADMDLSGEELLKIMTARSMGAPISLESVHALMVDKGLTKLDFETEMEKVEEEVAQGLVVPRTPGATEDDNDDE